MNGILIFAMFLFTFAEDALLFFKYYDPRSETMSYCGHMYVSMASHVCKY